jgi:hypothetical protein
VSSEDKHCNLIRNVKKENTEREEKRKKGMQEDMEE